jgi:hypothetical protein
VIFVLIARKYPDGQPKRPRFSATGGGVSFRTIFGSVPKWIGVVSVGFALVGWASVRGQISVPAFGHEKSPPLGADVQFLASVDRPPF